MRYPAKLWIILSFVSAVLLLPGLALADAPSAADPCAEIKELDAKNLCRALKIEGARTEEQRMNRYQNKNHSTYYCSLIKDKDKKVFCFAVINQSKSQCGNIIDAELEKQCNAQVK